MSYPHFHRNSVLAFPKTAEYGDPIERPLGPPLYARGWFWTGLAAVVVLWAAVFLMVTV